GLSLPLLVTIFVARVEVHQELYDVLAQRKQAFCAAYPQAGHCVNLARYEAECGPNHIPGAALALEGQQKFYSVDNGATTKCEFLGFQAFLLTIGISGLVPEIMIEEQNVKTKNEEGKSVVTKRPVSSGVIKFFDKQAQSKLSEIDNRLRKIHALKDRKD